MKNIDPLPSFMNVPGSRMGLGTLSATSLRDVAYSSAPLTDPDTSFKIGEGKLGLPGGKKNKISRWGTTSNHTLSTFSLVNAINKLGNIYIYIYIIYIL